MTELNYKVHKNKNSSQWVVLINGLFASLESWNSSIDFLTKNFNVLRYDGRGQGDSPRPIGSYQLDNLIDDLKELVDELEIEKFSIVGLSNGARVGLGLCEAYPERVSNIVACDTYDEVSPLLACKLKSWLFANRKGGPAHRFEVATPWIWGESILAENTELLEMYRQRASEEKVHVIEGLIEGALENRVIDLSKINCPILMLAGQEDLLTPPFMHERMLKKLSHNDEASFLMVSGGHASLLEYPQTVEEIVVPWLREKNSNCELTSVTTESTRIS